MTGGEEPEVVTETVEDVYADLVGVAEIAAGLGLGIHRVKRWIERRDKVGCPHPVRTLRLGNVYSMAEWRGWFALWRITRGSETWNRQPADPSPDDSPPSAGSSAGDGSAGS